MEFVVNYLSYFDLLCILGNFHPRFIPETELTSSAPSCVRMMTAIDPKTLLHCYNCCKNVADRQTDKNVSCVLNLYS